MFYFGHFSHGIGDRYHFRRGIAAGLGLNAARAAFIADKIGNFPGRKSTDNRSNN